MKRNPLQFKIRLMKSDDFDAVVKLDEKVVKVSRADYYRMKFEELIQSADRIPASLLVEQEDGKVLGFAMGAIYIGEYGISKEATLEAIVVDPDSRNKGVGKLLIDEFVDHMSSLGVRKISTLVNSADSDLMHFFTANRFTPSKTINMERIHRD
jgi:ribosomal protein S18 acetylase RimI-like enzyme